MTISGIFVLYALIVSKTQKLMRCITPALSPILKVVDYFKRQAKRKRRKIEKHVERERQRRRRSKRLKRKQRAKEKLAADARKKMSKKQHRIEKKKRKLAALVKMVQLNDKDRVENDNSDNEQIVKHHEVEGNKSGVEDVSAGCNKNKKSKKRQKKLNDMVQDNTNHVTENDDGFIKVTYHKKSRKNSSSNKSSDSDEVKHKRAKLTAAAITESIKNIGDNLNNISSADADTTAETLDNSAQLLTDEQYRDLKRQLQHRKQELKQVPVLHLHEMGSRANLSLAQDQRTPIFLTDVQHLLMSVIMQGKSPCQPQRWCHIEHAHTITHSIVLIIEGMSLYHYHAYESAFERSKSIFEGAFNMEMIVPLCKKDSIIKELSQVPLIMMQSQELIDLYGSLDVAVDMKKDPILLVKTIFPIDKSEDNTSIIKDLHPDDKFPRTKLLLSAMQMVDEGYPMPLRGELGLRFKNYKYTKTKYTPVTNQSPMFGIDCEMCMTVNTNELTRISVVNEKMETLYETLVRPRYKIVDYLTRFSGITADMMISATKTLDDVQQDIQNLLPSDAILVGQSLNSDLNAMQMMHPYVIDTSVCFNLTGTRKRKSKLKLLSETFLKELIQENIDGHDSVEDSIATLKLVKLKLTQGLDFGDEILLRKKRYQEVLRAANEMNKNINNNLQSHANKTIKSVAIISTGSCLEEQLKTMLEQANDIAFKNAKNLDSTTGGISIHEYASNKDVIRKTREIALEHALTLSNINVHIEGQEMEGVSSTVKKIDKYISKLWKSVAHNGMFIVLMGGSEECPSGLAQIAFKKKPATLSLPEVPAPTVSITDPQQ